MSEVSATAPGKIILFGEHAVVHGQPAIAVPVRSVWSRAVVRPGRAGGGAVIIAANLARTIVVRPDVQSGDHPLAEAARILCRYLGRPLPDVYVLLHSTIPVASGLGSGAAATTALMRALCLAIGVSLDDATLNSLVYEVEKLYHGTPSGIDNTVIVYNRPVYFRRDEGMQTFAIGAPLHIVIADTGIASPTHQAVGDVRQLYEAEPSRLGLLFERIGEIVRLARQAIANGDVIALGSLMRENHALLRDLTVSCPELDMLAAVAEEAGARGAKLSGAGRGGNLIALIEPECAGAVTEALLRAGARRVICEVLS